MSTAYDLMKGCGQKREQERWNVFIQPRQDNTIALRQMPDTDFPSLAEKETLDASQEISAIEEEVAQANFMEDRFRAPANA